MPGCRTVGAAERPAVSEASMEEEGEPRALRVHWESLPCWPRGLVTAATQRSFIRGLTREMLTHCYAHQSGDRDANYLFTNRSFRSLSGRAPDSVCRRICSYQGKCPGEGGSALSDWAGPPHPERGPEQLHTLCWRLLLALPHSFPPGSFRASPTSAHTCPHLILPLPTSVHTCPTPAHICLQPLTPAFWVVGVHLSRRLATGPQVVSLQV